MKNYIQPLVVTPKHYPDESLMGFLLRTSEMNGYRSPFILLAYSGLSESQTRNIRPSIENVAQLYGRSWIEFANMDNNMPGSTTGSKQWNLLGQAVPAIYINAKTARICPECIIESGYVSQYWYMRHSVGCPRHARIAIDMCPSCGKKLSWCRPGLLTCPCGYDLSLERGEQIQDPSILTMLNLLDAKLQAKLSSFPDLHKHGFPIQELESMTLSTLLGIIYRVQPKKQTRLVPVDANNSLQSLTMGLSNAYGMLSGWPNGLHDYLENLQSHQFNSKSYSLIRQFQPFYNSFFRSGLPEAEVEFLRKGFVTFGNERWKDNGFVDIRLAHRVKTESHSTGIAGLAKYLGIRPPTLMKYVKAGLIEGTELRAGKRMRRIFDLEKVQFKPSSGKYLTQREAAMFLGIPVSLLRALKSDGTYKIVRLADGLEGYDELDLIEFRDSIINKASSVDEYDPEKHIKLGELLRKKMKAQQIPLQLIAEIKQHKLQPCGRAGNQIRDIFLMREVVMAMVKQKMAA